MYDQLEPIHTNDTKVKQLGIEICINMCEELLAAGSPGLHFYTINLEKTVDTVVDRLENVDI
jgi:methylenetetrahydrofolate reductase (NADPH)